MRLLSGTFSTPASHNCREIIKTSSDVCDGETCDDPRLKTTLRRRVRCNTEIPILPLSSPPCQIYLSNHVHHPPSKNNRKKARTTTVKGNNHQSSPKPPTQPPTNHQSVCVSLYRDRETYINNQQQTTNLKPRPVKSNLKTSKQNKQQKSPSHHVKSKCVCQKSNK